MENIKKYLIISDLHLSDKFEEAKYNKLVEIISQVDNVIINGDFWDGLLTTWDNFLQSKWNKLFPLLKEKNTVYIHGNHDPKKISDLRSILFANKDVNLLNININGNEYHIEHGNFITNGKFENNLHYTNNILNRLSYKLQDYFHYLIRHIFLRYKRIKLKKYSEKSNKINIFGHTHVGEIDLDKHYLNSGLFCHGHLEYLIIEKKVTLVKQRFS